MFEQILSSLDGLTDLERADVLRVLMSKDSRLSKVKALLGITTTDQDDVLEFVIQTVEDMILSYINQDTLPPRLLRVENCPERISCVKVVILWPSETQALNAPQSN